MAARPKALADKVQERLAFLQDVLKFVPDLVRQWGIQTRHDVKPNHTEDEYELTEFLGFSFHTEGSFSMYGGDSLKVWFGPDKKLVLSVNWFDLPKAEVYTFDESTAWQRALRTLARLEKEAVKRKERAQAKERSEKERRTAQEAAETASEQKRRQFEQQLPELAQKLKIA